MLMLGGPCFLSSQVMQLMAAQDPNFREVRREALLCCRGPKDGMLISKLIRRFLNDMALVGCQL